MPIHNQLTEKWCRWKQEEDSPCLNDVSNPPFRCSKVRARRSCATPRLGLISLTAAIRLSPSQMPVRGG
jgi:hypothetical protein